MNFNTLSYSLYKKAIELYPDHSYVLLKYAGFLRHSRKDAVQAEEYYKKACTANSQNSDALGRGHQGIRVL